MRFPTKPLTWTTEMPESSESAPSGSGDLPVYDLVVAGDVVPDIIVGDVVGEIAFGHVETIMACGAARLGLRVAFVGVVGNDPAGRFILEEVGRRGVDTSACVVLPGRATGLTVHIVRPGADRDRAMLTSTGCVGELTAAMLRVVLELRVTHLHVGSFYLLPKLADDLATIFAEARGAGRTTSLDTQGDPHGLWRGGLREALSATDLYFPNRSEAGAVAASLSSDGLADEDLGRTLAALAALCPRAVVKCGAEGAATIEGAAVLRAPALSTEPVDTIGAGDSFDAGYIYGFLHDWSAARCLAFAAACGSLSTRAAGGVDAQPGVAEVLAALDGAP